MTPQVATACGVLASGAASADTVYEAARCHSVPNERQEVAAEEVAHGMPLPSRDNVAWQDAERERAFWQKHHDEFLRRYPNQFVAVKNGQVIAASYDLRDLITDPKEQGLKPTDVWLHFFATATHAAL